MQERLPFRPIRPSKGKGGLTCTSQPARLTTILKLLSLLPICCGVGSIRCSSTAVHDNSTDMISLLDFKRAITNDSRQALRSWHAGVPLCTWKGVVCSSPKHPGRVMELDLHSLSLSGTISPSLGNLTFLRS
ncbi:hypothetical protein CFC21_094682 [Triticum aestivum]|uniref:Leucine-rich repeat-containing N-terminal plant-type domain-containing protein n=2 Tax=Triticum aestivum TaxID=4565 RepID=A0A9R1LNQ4_WHEAT|nr:hypothetical protein CFC21_094682 [Triticum aestivum]